MYRHRQEHLTDKQEKIIYGEVITQGKNNYLEHLLLQINLINR